MRTKPVAAALLALTVLGALAASLGWWAFEGRWRPRTLARDGAVLDGLLPTAGWVSPGLKGPAVYMISFRTCPDCVRMERSQFPILHNEGIDTRVLMVARRSRSTAPERATVAELWRGRSWKLYTDWMATPAPAWRAAGLPDADLAPAPREAVEHGRTLVDQLQPVLARNGVSPTMHYPTLLWKGVDGRWRGCNCEDPRTYRYMQAELAALSRTRTTKSS